MSKKAHKNCALKNLVTVADKRYGYRNRYCGVGFYNLEEGLAPKVSISKLFPCSRGSCSKIENIVGEFKCCSNCSTIYCSKTCQTLDWSEHKSFCKSEDAYMSRLNKWQDALDPKILKASVFLEKSYIDAWNEWIDSEKMKNFLKFIRKNKEHFDPKVY